MFEVVRCGLPGLFAFESRLPSTLLVFLPLVRLQAAGASLHELLHDAMQRWCWALGLATFGMCQRTTSILSRP